MADLFYLQGIVFLHTKARKIKLLTATHVENREKQTQLDVITEVFHMYENERFSIISLIKDIEFECIRDEIKPVNLETVAADDHVGAIEVSVNW